MDWIDWYQFEYKIGYLFVFVPTLQIKTQLQGNMEEKLEHTKT